MTVANLTLALVALGLVFQVVRTWQGHQQIKLKREQMAERRARSDGHPR